MTATPMQLAIRTEGDATVVAVSGPIEAAAAPELRRRLDDLVGAGSRVFVLDLADVPFMDSAGIATLVALFKRVRLAHGDVRLAALQPRVERLVRLLRLERVLPVFPDADSAAAAQHTPSGG